MANDKKKEHDEEIKNEHGLTEIEQKVVEMYVFDGKSKTEIAKELDKHRNTIRNWLNKPELAAEVRRCADELARQTKADMNNFLTLHGMEILEHYYSLAKSSDKRVSAQCCQYLLDRYLGKPNTKVEIDADIDGSSAVPSADDILQQLRERKLEVYNPNKTAKTG